MEGKKKRVMFLCTGNSVRSQMAEGFLRALSGSSIEVRSAGIFPAGLHPRAVAVMKEAGIDISGQYSKEMDRRLISNMDIVITLCGNAEEVCPQTPPSVKRIHWPIKDPIGAVGTEEGIMGEFRKARDEIKMRVEKIIKELNKGQ
jgi:arsenate reductase